MPKKSLLEKLQESQTIVQEYEKKVGKINTTHREKTKSFFAIGVGLIYAVYIVYIGTAIAVNTPSEILVETTKQFGVTQIIPIVTLVFGYYFGHNKD